MLKIWTNLTEDARISTMWEEKGTCKRKESRSTDRQTDKQMNKQVRHEEELFGMQMFRESIILLFQGDAWSTVSHVLVGILSTAYHQKVKQQTVN